MQHVYLFYYICTMFINVLANICITLIGEF